MGDCLGTGATAETPPVVLIVEDEPTVLALSASNIEEFGYTVLSAANGREALALLEDGATVDLLFTDINMPDGPDGLELRVKLWNFALDYASFTRLGAAARMA